MSGLDTDNYPLFLKMLRSGYWVLDALKLGIETRSFCSRLFPERVSLVEVLPAPHRWRAGGIYPKTLAIVLGVLQNTYSSPRDGYKIYRLSVADVDNLGKHLEKEKGQNDPRNRCLLDILDRIGSLEGLRWDESMEQVARQALKIRSNSSTTPKPSKTAFRKSFWCERLRRKRSRRDSSSLLRESEVRKKMAHQWRQDHPTSSDFRGIRLEIENRSCRGLRLPIHRGRGSGDHLRPVSLERRHHPENYPVSSGCWRSRTTG
jgi:hypothetical protein